MKVFHDFENFPGCENAIVTNGTFDGVHLGHQFIIRRLVHLAKQEKGVSVLLTLWPHPRHVLQPEKHLPKLLMSFDEKVQALKPLDLDYVVKIPFTRTFSQISSEDFIRNYLLGKLGTKKLVIGYNHFFGKDKEGSFDYLKKNHNCFGFEIEEIPMQTLHDTHISSNKIRKALEENRLDEANKYLGRPYTISGTVGRGDRIGSKIGFPTANIEVNTSYKLIPNDGVYAVRVNTCGELKKGMFYIGNRPTIGGELKRNLEVNIFDFEKDIYAEQIQVLLIARIRGDWVFNSMDELKAQLELDKIQALKILNS